MQMILLELDTQSVDAQGSVREALLSLADSLESDPDSVENAAYEAAKSAGAKPRDVYVHMYQILLGSASGPRLGPFMADLGAAKVASRIRDFTILHDGSWRCISKTAVGDILCIPSGGIHMH